MVVDRKMMETPHQKATLLLLGSAPPCIMFGLMHFGKRREREGGGRREMLCCSPVTPLFATTTALIAVAAPFSREPDKYFQ